MKNCGYPFINLLVIQKYVYSCCMDIKPLKFNHHSSRVNSKRNKLFLQTDIKRTLHDPGRIKNLKKKIKCLVYKTSPHVSGIAD